jgi:hypothetical protein
MLQLFIQHSAHLSNTSYTRHTRSHAAEADNYLTSEPVLGSGHHFTLIQVNIKSLKCLNDNAARKGSKNGWRELKRERKQRANARRRLTNTRWRRLLCNRVSFFLLPPEQLDFTPRAEFFISVAALPTVIKLTFWGGIIGALLAIGAVIAVADCLRRSNAGLIR